MNLLFCVEPQTLGSLVCCLKSIVLHGGYHSYNVYIVHTDINDILAETMAESYGDAVTFHFLRIPESVFGDTPKHGVHSITNYHQFIAPFLLPQNIERVLYLDTDTLVINSMQELYETDMEGCIYAGCSHLPRVWTKYNQNKITAEKLSALIDPEVLLINLPELRNTTSREAVLSSVRSNTKIQSSQKHDLLRNFYGPQAKILNPLQYNLSDKFMGIYNLENRHSKIDLEWIRQNTVIINYCGKNKPWNNDYSGELGIFYRECVGKP